MNTHTKSDPETIRKEIQRLCDKRVRGDLNEKSFQRAWTDRTIDLFRAVVSRRLAESESILREHHVILAHFKLTQSVLREPEQWATSLFGTDHRLIRLRCVVRSHAPVRCDETDRTVIDEVRYDRILSLKSRRKTRPGEIAAGAVIGVFALVFQPLLQVTGLFMVGLGVLGIIHGLLLPTRWIQVVTVDHDQRPEPILIHVLRKKSARNLMRLLREKTRHR